MDLDRPFDIGFGREVYCQTIFFAGCHLDDRRGIGGEQEVAVGEHRQVVRRALDGYLPFDLPPSADDRHMAPVCAQHPVHWFHRPSDDSWARPMLAAPVQKRAAAARLRMIVIQ